MFRSYKFFCADCGWSLVKAYSEFTTFCLFTPPTACPKCKSKHIRHIEPSFVDMINPATPFRAAWYMLREMTRGVLRR